jgi:crossover junction endodeoxyribonuclease RuvC
MPAGGHDARRLTAFIRGHRMFKVVGIDPGLAATGIGIVSGRGVAVDGYSFGCIQTSKSTCLSHRLDHIFSRLMQVFTAEAPDLVVVEDVFSLKEYPKSGISLGQVSGVVLLAAARTGRSAGQVPVREAKQALTGNGNASKAQLETAVRRLLGHPSLIRPSHSADALGLAIIGLYRCGGRPEPRVAERGVPGPRCRPSPSPLKRHRTGGSDST